MAAGEYDIAIVGAGLAGLSAALTAARLGRATLVLTGGGLGGHLVGINRIDGVPGFPDGVPGYDLLPMTEEEAARLGAEFAPDEATGFETGEDGWTVGTAGGAIAARAVIFAAGTALLSLAIPGEARLAGKGVSQCASCDAPLLRGQAVAVIGGGDSAMQEALTLAETVDTVLMLVRGDALAGQGVYRDAVAAAANIQVRFGVTAEEVLGQDTVTALRVRTGFGAEEIAVAAVFPFVGLAPNTALLAGLAPLAAGGRVLTDADLRAGPRGLFAAGTVRDGTAGRAAAAAGDGAAAALAADRYLTDGAWPANH